jgi:uncharacterized protein YdcH (DUF465 family)
MTGLSSFFNDRNELDDDVDVVIDNNEDDGDDTYEGMFKQHPFHLR